MSSFDSSRRLTSCPPPAQREKSRDDFAEPATRRMRPEEVRALLQTLDGNAPRRARDEPPQDDACGLVDLTDGSELPTLLYRPKQVLNQAMLRIDVAEERDRRTIHGLGPAKNARVVFASTPRQPIVEGVADGPVRWPDASEPHRGSLLPHERSAFAERTRRLAWLLAAIVIAAPVIVAFVHLKSASAPALSVPPLPVVPVVPVATTDDDVTLRADALTLAEMTLPRALEASAAALVAGGDADRRAGLARATERLLAGETVEALADFRALSAREPHVPMLDRVVRVLEQQLEACAARGGEACH